MTAQPFLKWAGGKGQLLKQFEALLPPKFARYFEPFVGAGAVFFALQPKHARLADANSNLVDCYNAIKKDVEAVIRLLRRYKYEEEFYYRIRAQKPEDLELAQRAARMIFLNKTGYNGLYRVNRSGQFNVPIGTYTNPTICDADNLRACAQVLKSVRIDNSDFLAVERFAARGDFVYFDPPYVPVSETSKFTAYTPYKFEEEEQRALADLFSRLAKRGVLVMLSNSSAPIVRTLYKRWNITEVYARRNINSKAGKRGKISELVVRNYYS